ncbi:hypothetical protein K488DRAFT_66505, partial [Vararia minispora EC-137]
VELHKELMVAVSCQKVQHVDAVLRAGFRRKAGLKSILEVVKLAGAGLYRVRGHTAEEELHALLLYRLGGARVLNVAHQVSGMLSTSTIRHHISLVSVIPSAAHPTHAEVEANVVAAFKPVHQVIEAAAEGAVPEAGVLHRALLIDEIAVTKRLRYDDRTNKIIGLCRDCKVGEGREFASEKDLDVLFDDIEREEIHLASEATIGALGVLTGESKLYSARPILASGSCKRETAEAHAVLIQRTLDALKARVSLTRTRIVCVSSDREARHGKALVQLTFKWLLAEGSPISGAFMTRFLFVCPPAFFDAPSFSTKGNFSHPQATSFIAAL